MSPCRCASAQHVKQQHERGTTRNQRFHHISAAQDLQKLKYSLDLFNYGSIARKGQRSNALVKDIHWNLESPFFMKVKMPLLRNEWTFRTHQHLDSQTRPVGTCTPAGTYTPFILCFSLCRQFWPSSCPLKSFHVHGIQSSSEKSHLNIA